MFMSVNWLLICLISPGSNTEHRAKHHFRHWLAPAANRSLHFGSLHQCGTPQPSTRRGRCWPKGENCHVFRAHYSLQPNGAALSLYRAASNCLCLVRVTWVLAKQE